MLRETPANGRFDLSHVAPAAVTVFGGWLLFVLCNGATAAESSGLQAFRAPNQLELAYLGAAADLRDPSLCERISPNAMHRVRKPTLTRSRCYYYLALNTGDLAWCDQVDPVPVEAGVMNWLDPERCRFQAGRIVATRQGFSVPFAHDILLSALGYTEADVDAQYKRNGAVDWAGFYAFVAFQEHPGARADFRARMAQLPDFSRSERAEDQALYFTEKDAEYELDWLATRAMRLCLEGRVSKDCRDELMRLRPDPLAANTEDGSDAQRSDRGAASGGATTPYRHATDLERASYDMALRWADADQCRQISPQAVAIGWSLDPGFLFLRLRSACLGAVAAATENQALCHEVVPIDREDLDGDGLTPEYCRASVRDMSASIYRTTLKPDWERVLQILGYAESDIPESVSAGRSGKRRWLAFADHLAASGTAMHQAFRERLGTACAQAPGAGQELFLTEAALQKHLYQFSVIRYHCSINRYGERYVYNGYSMEPPKKFGGPFRLVDHHGETVSDEDFHGRYLLVFFGYTACPDVCPLNLVTIAEALNRLGEWSDQVQPVFISVDAERDTPELLASYVSYFDPRILGLTGTAQQIRRAAKAYHAHYFAGEVDGRYVVDHTAWTYLIGPDGRPIRYFDHGTGPDEIAAEIARIIRGTESERRGVVAASTGG